jgi:hypothetical protein
LEDREPSRVVEDAADLAHSLSSPVIPGRAFKTKLTLSVNFAREARAMMRNCASENPFLNTMCGPMDSGLARFCSRLGMTREFEAHARILAAGIPPELYSKPRPSKQRAQGMPGAGRTPSLVCRKVETHTRYVTTGEPTRPALPAQWLYGLLRALPGVPGLLAPVVSGSSPVT